MCLCVCTCFQPTITRLAKGLAITFSHLPSVTSQKIQCRLNVEAVVEAKWDHQQGSACWDLDQIVGLRISPGVLHWVNITIWDTLGPFCILRTFLGWERQWAEKKNSGRDVFKDRIFIRWKQPAGLIVISVTLWLLSVFQRLRLLFLSRSCWVRVQCQYSFEICLFSGWL